MGRAETRRPLSDPTPPWQQQRGLWKDQGVVHVPGCLLNESLRAAALRVWTGPGQGPPGQMEWQGRCSGLTLRCQVRRPHGGLRMNG